jgi:hypothetical protein
MATDWEIMAIIQLARPSSDPRVLRRLRGDWRDRFECLLERFGWGSVLQRELTR